ncbi:MAG: Crp/Fnr family transcriptional regulator [Desulfobacterales bacterium]|jgi:CRP-like cAMP-binding protein
MIDIKILKTVEALQGLKDDQLAAIQQCCEKLEFTQGQRLFSEGDDSAHLWIVLEGEVELRNDRPKGHTSPVDDPISFISEAELFGWSSFMPPFEYKLSAYAASQKCAVVRIAKESLVKLFEKDAGMGFELMSHILRVIGTHFYQFRNGIAQRWGHDIMSGW